MRTQKEHRVQKNAKSSAAHAQNATSDQSFYLQDNRSKTPFQLRSIQYNQVIQRMKILRDGNEVEVPDDHELQENEQHITPSSSTDNDSNAEEAQGQESEEVNLGPNQWDGEGPIPTGTHGNIPTVVYRGDERRPEQIYDESENRYDEKTEQTTGPGGFRAKHREDWGARPEGSSNYNHHDHQHYNTDDTVSFSKDAYTPAHFAAGAHVFAVRTEGMDDAVAYNDVDMHGKEDFENQDEVASRRGASAEAVIMSAETDWDSDKPLSRRRTNPQFMEAFMSEETDSRTRDEMFDDYQTAAIGFDQAEARLNKERKEDEEDEEEDNISSDSRDTASEAKEASANEEKSGTNSEGRESSGFLSSVSSFFSRFSSSGGGGSSSSSETQDRETSSESSHSSTTRSSRDNHSDSDSDSSSEGSVRTIESDEKTSSEPEVSHEESKESGTQETNSSSDDDSERYHMFSNFE